MGDTSRGCCRLMEGRDPLQCTTGQIPRLAGRTKFDRKNVSYLLEGFGITKGCAGNEERVCRLSLRELVDCPGRNTHFFAGRGLKRVCFDLERRQLLRWQEEGSGASSGLLVVCHEAKSLWGITQWTKCPALPESQALPAWSTGVQFKVLNLNFLTEPAISQPFFTG